jgi:hypothetical protein
MCVWDGGSWWFLVVLGGIARIGSMWDEYELRTRTEVK